MVNLEKYNEMLVETNKAFNLTAHKTQERSWIFNVQDSLLFNDDIRKFFKENADVIDLGSGSGSPSIPLKISFPHANFVLIDSTLKKIKFLQSVIDELKLENTMAVHARIEDYTREKCEETGENLHKESFDIVTARAVAPLNELVKLAMPLLKKGGVLLAYKGPNYSDEIAAAKHIMTRLRAKVVDVIEKNLDPDTKRFMLVIKKI